MHAPTSLNSQITATYSPPAVSSPERNPWLWIWLAPSRTVQARLSDPSRRTLHILAITGGCVNFVVGAWGWLRSVDITLQLLLIPLLSIGSGLSILYITSGIYTMAGRLVGGKGSWRDLQVAVAWAQVPVAATGGLVLISVAVFGVAVLDPEVPRVDTLLSLVLLKWMGFNQLILALWAFGILLGAIAGAHRISLLRVALMMALLFAALFAFAIALSVCIVAGIVLLR